MPNTNSPTLLVPDSANTTGKPMPLSYGFQWATGYRSQAYTLPGNEGNSYWDFWRCGIYLLGEGEWDGCNELWNQGVLQFQSEFDDLTRFHFHRGTDAVIGSGLTNATSTGPDQGVDSIWTEFPPAVTPLCYSRIAYYTLFMKQESEYAIYQGGTPDRTNGNNWADLAPIGLWRTMRTRLFDGDGNQNGYAFNTNPAWHILDVILRKKIKPDYNISLSGPDTLTPAEAAYFNFESFYNSSTYFAQRIQQTDGSWRARFEHHNTYDGTTTLPNIISTMLRSCRGSFTKDGNGALVLQTDAPRASVFDIGRLQVLSFTATEKDVSSAPNRVTGKYRDLLVAAFAIIANISCPDHTNPTVTFESYHPCVAGDYIVIGGTDTIYDGYWTVASTPGNPDGDLTLTLATKGSNYPASYVSDGNPWALAGLRYTRFENRASDFNHQAHQLARGAIGVNIPRQRKKISGGGSLDFGVSTYDQVSRICRYELLKRLGPDTYANGEFSAPYVSPKGITVSLEMLAVDDNGNGPAIGIQNADRVTLDDTAEFDFANDYEVVDIVAKPYSANVLDRGTASGTLAAQPSGGTVELQCGPYDEGAMVDTTNLFAAGWQDVPNSDPDQGGGYTGVPLGDGGTLAFFSGGAPTGYTYQLPPGFPPAQVMNWVSPQGYIEYGHDLHIIRVCSADSNRRLTLSYTDGEGNIWPGDVNYFGCTWLSTSSTTYTSSTNQQWLQATLAGSGAEEILIGWLTNFGAGAAGTAGGLPSTITLPAGWEMSQMIAVAFPYDTSESVTDNHCHVLSCSVDGSGNCTFEYQDGEGNVWDRPVQVFVFCWKNNGGTVTMETDGATSWVNIPVGTTDNPLMFRVGTALLSDQTTTSPPYPTQMTLPAGVTGDSFQAIASPAGFTDDGNPSHGIRALYVDNNLYMNASMEDGEGHIKLGNGTALGVLCE